MSNHDRTCQQGTRRVNRVLLKQQVQARVVVTMTGVLDVELPLRTPNIQDQLRLASHEVHGSSHTYHLYGRGLDLLYLRPVSGSPPGVQDLARRLLVLCSHQPLGFLGLRALSTNYEHIIIESSRTVFLDWNHRDRPACTRCSCMGPAVLGGLRDGQYVRAKFGARRHGFQLGRDGKATFALERAWSTCIMRP